MSILATITTTCLLACLGLTKADGATVAGHVYVTYESSILRYPMANGVPQPKPDHVFRHAGGAVAVDRAGNLYADGRAGIVVFPNGSTKPDRAINLPLNYGAYSMTVDNEGYLYVSALAYSSGALLLVYAPGAHGQAHPVATYNDGPFEQMATDNAGDLFTTAFGAIDVLEDARHGGQKTRSFQSPSLIGPTGIAIDGNEIYVENIGNQPGGTSFVSVYPVTATGKVRATRSILAPAGSSALWTGELAVDARYVYVFETLSEPRLFVYDKNARGRVAPVSVSPLRHANGTFAPTGTVGP